MADKIEWPENKDIWPENTEIDYSDFYEIKATKVKYLGEFTHWSAELSFAEDGWYCEVSAPTMGSAIDEVMNYLYDSVYEWTKDDANNIR